MFRGAKQHTVVGVRLCPYAAPTSPST
jgi:hypothetical protein